MPDLSNDMLTLWLRAKDGLPADEARALIERLAEMEREHAAEVDDLQIAAGRSYDEGHADALQGTAAFEEGRAQGVTEGAKHGRHAALCEVLRIIRGPGWGPKPTRAAIVEGIEALAREPVTA
jgi:hypothetical protein